MTNLYIAEKPSLGKGIAQYLPGPHKSGNGHIVCGGGNIVTWARGHIFEQADPELYTPDDVPLNSEGKKRWRLQELPIFPEQWIKLPKADARAQIKVIPDLLKQADTVVNAGDPDREGQLLVDEILEEMGWKGPTKRIWLAALDEQSVRKALASLKDNSDYRNLSAAAEARSRADWLVGMNLTRAFTLVNTGSGVLSIGRVQTPTLALIVRRDEAIEQFKAKDFFVPRIQTAKGPTSFWSAWVPVEGAPGLDEENRLTNKSVADTLAAAAKGAGKAIVENFQSKEQKQSAPLGFSLAELQKACSAKFGMSAQQVLDCAQALYEEHKAASYPRTDCRYLPEEQFAESGRVLSALAKHPAYGPLVAKADIKLKSGIWDTGKVTAHHAIIPTGEVEGTLGEARQKVYDLIVRSYLAQFYPPYVYRATKMVLVCVTQRWQANGKVPVSAGWKAVYALSTSEDGDEDDQQGLPVVLKGDELPVVASDVQAKQTKPPKRFTDGTLIEAMSSIHKYVEDPEAKKKLKETSGLGTEATRASIIEKLLERGFIERRSKALQSTSVGRALVNGLPKVLTDPVTTAQWEDVLSAIADGRVRSDVFEQKQQSFVEVLIQVALKTRINVGAARPASGAGGSGKTPARSKKRKEKGNGQSAAHR